MTSAASRVASKSSIRPKPIIRAPNDIIEAIARINRAYGPLSADRTAYETIDHAEPTGVGRQLVGDATAIFVIIHLVRPRDRSPHFASLPLGNLMADEKEPRDRELDADQSCETSERETPVSDNLNCKLVKSKGTVMMVCPVLRFDGENVSHRESFSCFVLDEGGVPGVQHRRTLIAVMSPDQVHVAHFPTFKEAVEGGIEYADSVFRGKL
jgi:hypothetical protein